MDHDVSSTCRTEASHRRAVAVLLVFLTLFVSTAIAAPVLASLREDPSSFAGDELPVGLAGGHFVPALYQAEAFVFFDGSRALQQAPLVISRPYRAPPILFPLSTI
jgi:hypothetical protein